MVKKEKVIEIIWFVVVAILFIVSLKMIKSGELQSFLASFGVLTFLIIFLLKASTLVIAPLGGTPLYIIAGAILGGFPGFLVCFLGDVFGSSICFLLSRKYGVRVLNFFAGTQNVGKILSTVNIVSTTRSFVKARLGFVSMPELLSYAAGLSQINFWKFSIINALFYLPVDLMLVFLGTRIASFGAKHYLLLPALAFVVACSGFLMLYNDYKKVEGM